MKQALVIQEDLIMQKILMRLVMSLGFDCHASSSIDELTAAEKSYIFDLVISDILFDDGISSFDYAFRLGEEIRSKHLYIVTRMGQEIIRQNFLNTKGVNGFFGIPFDLDVLERELQRLRP